MLHILIKKEFPPILNDTKQEAEVYANFPFWKTFNDKTKY